MRELRGEETQTTKTSIYGAPKHGPADDESSLSGNHLSVLSYSHLVSYLVRGPLLNITKY